jgi:hypothetical protein
MVLIIAGFQSPLSRHDEAQAVFATVLTDFAAAMQLLKFSHTVHSGWSERVSAAYFNV